MKISCLFPVACALSFFVSCEKPPSEADKNAQVEKEVQARLDAEHQAQEKDRLAQQSADLAAREKALADKENAAVAPTPTAAPRITSSSSSVSSSEESEDSQSYETFYRKLEPYGSWRETDDYGYVFQPREAQSRTWRPYTDGRWTYTDAGWTWVSEEAFGWATYHYGRWTRLSGVGWVWVPGDEWAPAWVSWRKGAQNVGWAPLPPEARFEHNKGIHNWADNYYDIEAGEYVFVPNEEIGAENLQRSVIPAERNVTIVNETTNVTNITYSNTTIVNEGPNYEELRAHSRRPVERLRLQREYRVEQNQAPHSRISGELLQIVTPRFNSRSTTAAPRTNGPRIERATVEHENAGGDQSQNERARQKMRSEATPPPDAPPKRFERPGRSASPPASVSTNAPVSTPATPIPTSTPVIATPPPRPTFTPRSTPVATPAPLATPVATPVTTPVAPLATPPPQRPQERRREETREKARRQLGATPVPEAETATSPPKQNLATPPPAASGESPAESAPPKPNALMRERARRMLQPGVKPSPSPAPQANPAASP